MSDLDALSLFSHCNGASVQQDRASGPDSVRGATFHTRTSVATDERAAGMQLC